jgi:hypothetical protein
MTWGAGQISLALRPTRDEDGVAELGFMAPQGWHGGALEARAAAVL